LPAFERAVSAPRILGQSAAWTHPDAAALAGAASLKDCIGNVLVPAFALKNQDHLGRLIAEKLKPLFKKGETLLCRFGARHIPGNLVSQCRREKVPASTADGAFIEIVLEDRSR
jgi:hypothetical protein